MKHSKRASQSDLDPGFRKRRRCSQEACSDGETDSFTDDSPCLLSCQPLFDEVDLEVALRERLLSTIEGRIQWATLLLSSLESPQEPHVPPQAADVDEFQDAAFDALEALETPSSFLFETTVPEELETSPCSFSPIFPVPQPRGIRTRSSRVPKLSQIKKLLYVRLSSGKEASQLAVLSCPVCARTQFSTLQGLLNHARLAHGIEWASHDACVMACAVAVAPDEDAWKTIEQDGVEVLWDGNVVGLRRLFERAVGVDGDFATSLQDAYLMGVDCPDVTAVPSTLLSRTLGIHADSPALAPFLGRAPKRRCIHVYDKDEDVDIVSLDDTPDPQGRASSEDGKRLGSWFRSSHSQRNTARPEFDLVVDLEAGGAASTKGSKDATEPLAHVATSRFHITARVRIEDRSLYLTKERQAQFGCNQKYRWMMAVTAPSYALPLASYLMRVTIAAPPVVSALPLKADKQPFAVIGTANDPFMAKVILEWIGGGRMDVEHWVDLDPSKSSTSVLGYDQMIDVELDRNATLLPVVDGNPPPLPPLDRELSVNYTTCEPIGGANNVMPDEYTYESILRTLLPRVPMTAKDVKFRSNVRMPYKLVANPTQLLALLPGKRKAIEWARARMLHALYVEYTALSSSKTRSIPLTVGDVYAWLEDTSLFPRPAGSLTPPPETKKKGKVKEKEGSPQSGDLSCPICGIKKRLHPGYDIKSEVDVHQWTCPVVQSSAPVKVPIISLSEAFSPAKALEQALYGSSRPAQHESHDLIPPSVLPTFPYPARDLVTLCPPELIVSVQRCVGRMHFPNFPGDPSLRSHPGFLASGECVDRNMAPAALLAATLKPFISTLIQPALEVAKHDVVLLTSASASASASTSAPAGKSGRASRLKKVQFVLTPSHVLRALHQPTATAKDLQNITPKEAVALCLSRLGLPYHFGSPSSQALHRTNPEHVAEDPVLKTEVE